MYPNRDVSLPSLPTLFAPTRSQCDILWRICHPRSVLTYSVVGRPRAIFIKDTSYEVVNERMYLHCTCSVVVKDMTLTAVGTYMLSEQDCALWERRASRAACNGSRAYSSPAFDCVSIETPVMSANWCNGLSYSGIVIPYFLAIVGGTNRPPRK